MKLRDDRQSDLTLLNWKAIETQTMWCYT